MNECKCGISLGIISTGLSIVAIAMANPRSSDSDIDYLGVIVGILALIIALLAIMFGYNQFVYFNKIKKKYRLLDSKINELEKLIEDKYLKAVGDSEKVVHMNRHIDKFVDNSVKSGIVKHNAGIMELCYSLDDAQKLDNPYVSAYLLNRLTKLMIGIGSIEELEIPKGIDMFDYDSLLRERIKENVEIVKNAKMEYLFMTGGKDKLPIYECLDKFLLIFKENGK